MTEAGYPKNMKFFGWPTEWLETELETVLRPEEINFSRYKNQVGGFYESFFQRANHPTRPLAFWIRYTIFSPKNHPEQAIGESWAVFFNGETKHHTVLKKEVPIAKCNFSPSHFFVKVDDAELSPFQLRGNLENDLESLSWDLSYQGKAPPLFLFQDRYYQGNFPAGKVLTGSPFAKYRGTFGVNGEKIEIQDWIGSQNHNWGSKHNDFYVWTQVSGFEQAPETFLEASSARLKLGPFLLPPLTPLVLRHKGKEFRLNNLRECLFTKTSFRYFTWEFRTQNSEIEIEGKISAPRESFVGLTYYNPPGGSKYCLNSKLAACELILKYKKQNKTERLLNTQSTAFEILTQAQDHGIKISA